MNKLISLRDYKSAQQRRNFLEKQLNINLDNIGKFSFTEDQVSGRNIENLIGATQIPIGIAGPLTLYPKPYTLNPIYIPLATTEGALVASVSRGCSAITQSGGAHVEVENVGITRGPVFKTRGINHGFEIKKWIEKHFNLIAQTAQKTSSHLKLLKIDPAIVGRNIFLRFSFDTTDAMGMNMATIATQEIAKLIEQKTKAQCISLAGNFDIDKKPAWLNFISGRGKKVWAEVVLPEKIVRETLRTTPEKITELVKTKNYLGSILAGSMGFNAHFANIIAAIFIATGQDPAHVVEGSLGVTTAEVVEKGDLYFSIYLPSLIVGTVGGGTHLPTQQEALKIMCVRNVLEYATISAAAVLAGELSLLASLAEGTLARAHQKLGRKK
ncbi:MAG: hydroxymethylglutaryl-CoA reductase (NADPH) [Microgenomates group bacterium Gr01-1014_7]|nr:MAG: hydroxymethylglutaryl-CoA reductase (NADPH) [Microgenomates group bacterium Gr01-1014_7]